jgi:hypothetical protein
VTVAEAFGVVRLVSAVEAAPVRERFARALEGVVLIESPCGGYPLEFSRFSRVLEQNDDSVMVFHPLALSSAS